MPLSSSDLVKIGHFYAVVCVRFICPFHSIYLVFLLPAFSHCLFLFISFHDQDLKGKWPSQRHLMERTITYAIDSAKKEICLTRSCPMSPRRLNEREKEAEVIHAPTPFLERYHSPGNLSKADPASSDISLRSSSLKLTNDTLRAMFRPRFPEVASKIPPWMDRLTESTTR